MISIKGTRTGATAVLSPGERLFSSRYEHVFADTVTGDILCSSDHTQNQQTVVSVHVLWRSCRALTYIDMYTDSCADFKPRDILDRKSELSNECDQADLGSRRSTGLLRNWGDGSCGKILSAGRGSHPQCQGKTGSKHHGFQVDANCPRRTSPRLHILAYPCMHRYR